MSSRRTATDQLGLPLCEESSGQAPVKAPCSFCGKELDLPSWSEAQAVNLRFCSPECRRSWTEEVPSFEVKLDGRPGRRGANWQGQSSQARQRDGYKCQACGVSEEELGRQLDVHHKIPYANFKSNLEANKLEHLISVCPACHVKLEAQLRRDLPLFRQP